MLFAPQPAGAGVGFPFADKLVHAALFALLAGAGLWRFPRWLPVLVASAAYAVLSEVLQALALARRSGDPSDVVADLVGVGLGLWVTQRRLRGR